MAEDKGQTNSDADLPGYLSPVTREVLVAAALVLAIWHFARPDLPVDAVFLGLLGFALFAYYGEFKNFSAFGVQGSLRRIENAAVALEEAREPGNVAEPPAAPVEPIENGPSSRLEKTVSVSAYLVKPAIERSPEFPLEKLLWAFEQIRIELIILAGSAGRLIRQRDWHLYSLHELSGVLREAELFSPELERGIRELTYARNAIVHYSPTRPVVESAAALAEDILAKVRSVRRVYIRIAHPDVPLFADPSASRALDTRAAILAKIGDDGRVYQMQVFPRGREYKRGSFVSWEWNMSHTTGDAWFRDAKTGELVHAFTSSAEFVGREFPEEWHIESRFSDPQVGLLE